MRNARKGKNERVKERGTDLKKLEISGKYRAMNIENFCNSKKIFCMNY